MQSRESAKKLAQKFLDTRWPECETKFIICDEHTIERLFGWVFFWNSKENLETKTHANSLQATLRLS
jgi:hypothetical protein